MASKQPDLLKLATQCVGKVGMPTATLARQVAKRQNNSDMGRMVAYRCNHCGQWHTGGTSKPRKPLAEI